MAKNDYLAAAVKTSALGPKDQVPVGVKISDDQVQNSAGGFVFEVSGLEKLNRFLMIGTEGGSFYASEKKLTMDNLANIAKMVESQGMDVARRTHEVSTRGLAHRQGPTLMVWALLIAKAEGETKTWVRDHTHEIVRTPTMLFQLAEYLKSLGVSLGRAGTRKALGSFYSSRNAGQLAYQSAKYWSRNGWNHQQMLRTVHPKGFSDEAAHAVMQCIGGKITPAQLEDQIGPNHMSGMARALDAGSDVKAVAKIVEDYALTWEMVPTEVLNDPKIWDVLVPNSGYMALVRNLTRLTRNGWLAPASSNRKWMISHLTDQDAIHRSKIHPFALFLASGAYGKGTNQRSIGWYNNDQQQRSKVQTWTPVTGITDALDEAFYLAFPNVEPTGKRHFIGVDVSGSMGAEVMPGVTCTQAAAALALVAARTEPDVQVMGFDRGLKPLDISGKSTLKSAVRAVSPFNMGGTNCALPFTEAKARGWEFDCFWVLTDSETWAGGHPAQALAAYRKSSGINARSLVVGMVANDFSIADPKDPGMMDAVGLDASLPQVANDFFMGRI